MAGMSAETSIPAFGGLPPKKLVSLGKRIQKTKKAYDVDTKLEKAFGGDWELGLRGMWHLVLHGVVNCDENLQLLVVLNGDLKRRPDPDERLAALEVVLRSITPARDEGYPTLLADVPALVFELVRYLQRHAPERALALYEAAEPNVQAAVGLAIVLAGEELPPAAAKRLTEAFEPKIGVPPSVGFEFDLDEIAERVGTSEQLAQLALGVLSDEERTLRHVNGLRHALVRAPVELVAAALRRITGRSATAEEWPTTAGSLRSILCRRGDLVDVFRGLPSTGLEGIHSDRPRLVILPLLSDYPEGLENLLSFSRVHEPVFRMEYEAFLNRLGLDRSLALAKRALDTPEMHPCRREWIPLVSAVFGEPAYEVVRQAIAQGLTRHADLAPADART